MAHEMTADEVVDSLTGHDEMAIAQHFGRTVGALTADQSMLGRALVFVLKRRDEGISDDDARNAALEMRLKDVLDYFAKEESVESGKGEPSPEPQPETSPGGASEPGDPETST